MQNKILMTAEDFAAAGTTPEEVVAQILTEHPEFAPAVLAFMEQLQREQEVKA